MGKVCTLDIVNGYVINQIRLEVGYKKQGELGEKFGMSHAAIGKIERGESSVSLEFLTILAEMIGTKPSKILSVIEDITDYLTAHDITFLSQFTYGLIYSLVKDCENDDNAEGIKKLITPNNFEDNITLELKKSIRNLVIKKPDFNIEDIQKQIESAIESLTPNKEEGTLRISFPNSVSEPLTGLHIGASLLATKIGKHRKAP